MKCKMWSLFNWFTGGNRSKKKKSVLSMIGYAVLMLYVLVVLGVVYGLAFVSCGEVLHNQGLDWLYFALYGISAFAMVFIGSVLSVKSQLFEARDNEMLLAMPIPPTAILISRIVTLLIISLVFELIVAVPAFLVRCFVKPFTISEGVFFLCITIGILLFSFAISMVFAWLISLVGNRLRNKTVITVIGSLAFLAAYFFIVNKAEEYLSYFLMHGNQVADAISGTVRPLYWLGNAIAQGNVQHFILTILCLVVPFILAIYILQKGFISIVTTKRGFTKKEYKEKKMKTVSPQNALIQKEALRLVTCSSYLLNAGLGVVMILVLAGTLIWKKEACIALLADMPDTGGFLAVCGVVVGTMLSLMTVFTAPSVSMEGTSLWVARSMPVFTKDILLAKIKLHCCVVMAAEFVFSVAYGYCLNLTLTETIGVMLAIGVHVMFIAALGLMFNIKHPNLNWVTETQAVKNNISVMLSMLVAFVLFCISTVIMLGISFILPGEVACIFGAIFYGGLFVLVYWWIMTKGINRYEML